MCDRLESFKINWNTVIGLSFGLVPEQCFPIFLAHQLIYYISKDSSEAGNILGISLEVLLPSF